MERITVRSYWMILDTGCEGCMLCLLESKFCHRLSYLWLAVFNLFYDVVILLTNVTDRRFYWCKTITECLLYQIWDFIWKILSKSYVELVSRLLRYPQASLSFLVSLLQSLCFSFVELIIAFLRAYVPFKHFACIILFVTALLWFDYLESWFSVCWCSCHETF